MNRWVYCLSEGPGEPIKIGVTQSISTRLQAARGHTWREIGLQWAVPGDDEHELALKRALRPRRIRNEWFDDRDDTIKGAHDGSDWRFGGDCWDHKKELHDAMRGRAAWWIDLYRSYEAARDEKFYRYFDLARADFLKRVATDAGIELDASLFRVRDDRPFMSILNALPTPEASA